MYHSSQHRCMQHRVSRDAAVHVVGTSVSQRPQWNHPVRLHKHSRDHRASHGVSWGCKAKCIRSFPSSLGSTTSLQEPEPSRVTALLPAHPAASSVWKPGVCVSPSSSPHVRDQQLNFGHPARFPSGCRRTCRHCGYPVGCPHFPDAPVTGIVICASPAVDKKQASALV